LNENITLDKPIHIGQAVLDISKLIMYELRYTTLPKYEQEFNGTIKCVGGDTDSFFLQVDKINLHQQLLPAMKRDNLLDTSNYPPTHSLFDLSCAAKLGCIKDEGKIYFSQIITINMYFLACGIEFKEWILLRPKLYSMLTVNESGIKRAKGVQHCVVKNVIRHNHYKEVRFLYNILLYFLLRCIKTGNHNTFLCEISSRHFIPSSPLKPTRRHFQFSMTNEHGSARMKVLPMDIIPSVKLVNLVANMQGCE
jgi:hypothetical protein